MMKIAQYGLILLIACTRLAYGEEAKAPNPSKPMIKAELAVEYYRATARLLSIKPEYEAKEKAGRDAVEAIVKRLRDECGAYQLVEDDTGLKCQERAKEKQ